MKDFPAQVAPPFGLTIMDLPERLPLPSKIVIRVLPKIDLRDRLGKSPNADDAYEVVTGTMQRALDGLDEERRLPVVGEARGRCLGRTTALRGCPARNDPVRGLVSNT